MWIIPQPDGGTMISSWRLQKPLGYMIRRNKRKDARHCCLASFLCGVKNCPTVRRGIHRSWSQGKPCTFGRNQSEPDAGDLFGLRLHWSGKLSSQRAYRTDNARATAPRDSFCIGDPEQEREQQACPDPRPGCCLDLDAGSITTLFIFVNRLPVVFTVFLKVERFETHFSGITELPGGQGGITQ